MRSVAEILKQYPRAAEQGLTAEEVQGSIQRDGTNKLTPLPREPLWKKFLEKFDEPIIKILLAAALLSMAVDLFKIKGSGPTLGGSAVGLIALTIIGAYLLRLSQWIPSLLFGLAIILFGIGLASGHALVEGLAVMIAVILATGVAFLSEYQSDREFEALNAHKDSLHVKVVRAGQFHTVPLEDVVVGDLVKLETGDEIPGDGRLLKATELSIDQSLMTGESVPVRKSPQPLAETAEGFDQPGCVYRGTQVVDGVGAMLVGAVGDASYLGQIARKLSADDGVEEEEEAADSEEARVKRKLSISKDLTPLQVKLQALAELISKIGYIAAVLIFCAQVLRGVVTGEIHVPTDFADTVKVFSALLDYFVLMVIIIVVAVPEGLPMSVTVSLALAMRKMTRANSLVRQLVACETIGSATVICSDKTGTLTQNKMQVVRLSWAGEVYDRDKPNWVRLDGQRPWPRDGKPEDWLALNAAVNSTANLEDKNGKLIVVGNNTEGALLQWLRENGIDHEKLRLSFAPVYQIHFSSERKRMTTVIRYGERLVTLVKGAPEWVLENCTHYQTGDGTVRPLTPLIRQAVEEIIRDSALQAMRTLAFAYAQLPADTPANGDALHARRDQLETGLVFTGVVAIRDPLREDVKEAIARCRHAGIEVKMITGDNVETARAIGYDIGLIANRAEPIDAEGAILTSAKFNELSDADLKKRLPGLRILARAKPLDKFRMVQLLQELGEVVAVTGDGTNDAPALKKADVGLAMGIAGTEVAKEASKIVLLDDSFATIVKAVQWGRSLYENIQRFIQFQLTINVSALTITFLGPLLFGVKAPFTVLQLLWINVIMDTFASIALCSEPPREGVMDLPPKRRDENILTPAMLRTIGITAAFFVVTMLALLYAMRGNPEKPGLFANRDDNTLWSFESAGTRTAVPKAVLEPESTNDKFKVTDENSLLHDQTGEVIFTVWQVSLFFSIYVFFQVWNQINCRSLVPEVSGLRNLWANPVFLVIASTVAIGQILIVSFGGTVFKVEPLSVTTWLGVAAFTMTVLVFAEVSRRIRLALAKTDTQTR